MEASGIHSMIVGIVFCQGIPYHSTIVSVNLCIFIELIEMFKQLVGYKLIEPANYLFLVILLWLVLYSVVLVCVPQNQLHWKPVVTGKICGD